MLRSIVLLSCALGLLTACGEDAPAARKSLGGVDGQRALSDLDDDQLERVCNAANAKLADALDEPGTHEGACLLGAHITAQAATAQDDELDEVDVCEDTLALCPEDRDTSYKCDNGVAARCEATVADFDNCIALANALYKDLADLDCDDVSNDDTEELDEQIQASVQACDVRLAGCFLGATPDGGTPDASVTDGGEDDDAGELDDDAG